MPAVLLAIETEEQITNSQIGAGLFKITLAVIPPILLPTKIVILINPK